MTTPAPAGAFTLVPGALLALADELAALSAELDDDVHAARWAAATVAPALDGEAGREAGTAATAWAALEEVLADATRALAGTLRAAVTAYLAEDVALAAAVGVHSRLPR